MKTTESRFPKPPIDAIPATNGEPEFVLRFSKAEADVLASLCDVALKAAGLPAAQAVETWMQKVRVAMLPPA